MYAIIFQHFPGKYLCAKVRQTPLKLRLQHDLFNGGHIAVKTLGLAHTIKVSVTTVVILHW